MVRSGRGHYRSGLVTGGVSGYGKVQYRSLRLSTNDRRGVRLW